MDIVVTCPSCKDRIEIFDAYNVDEVKCEKCGTKSELMYDEGYDEETGDEEPMFWLEKIPTF